MSTYYHPAMSTRVGVFFDWQNTIFRARDAFGPGTNGNVNPVLVAGMLANSRPPDQGSGHLEFIHIHTGAASQLRDRRTYAANRRQFAKWQNSSQCLTVFARMITYRSGGNVEKGVDVALAIDMVRCVLSDDACDVAVLFSADADLLPALELIAERKSPSAIEVASWSAPGAPPPLDIPFSRLRQHRLDAATFRRVEDHSDYNVSHHPSYS
jgi:hypothetical protein